MKNATPTLFALALTMTLVPLARLSAQALLRSFHWSAAPAGQAPFRSIHWLAASAGQAHLRSIHWSAASAGQAEPPQQRQRRESPPQHQVERTLDYFVGRWRFEYVGGEFPPLSGGGRAGTLTFTRVGASNFVAGQLDGELAGKPYRESQTLGFDPESHTLVLVERRPDGVELVSLGAWRSPLAITWQTVPLQANGKTYQLRRVFAVTSESAFQVTEEFSIDGGPYRRLGSGFYTRQP